MKIKILTALAVGALFIVSCDKGKSPAQNSVVQPSTVNETVNHARPEDDTKMTLAEFANSCESEQESEFFARTVPVDNNGLWLDTSITNMRPRFRWHGSENGCSRPLGICMIIPIGMAGYPDVAELPVGAHEGKLIINFPDNIEGNFGITIDGYMPILFDVEIPEESMHDLGIDFQHIKAGIYKAHYDEESQRYTGVVLDLH